jgi:predicted  nucleic acid-binding Zn-ribbon protein
MYSYYIYIVIIYEEKVNRKHQSEMKSRIESQIAAVRTRMENIQKECAETKSWMRTRQLTNEFIRCEDRLNKLYLQKWSMDRAKEDKVVAKKRNEKLIY